MEDTTQNSASVVFRTGKSWLATQEPILLWQVTPWVNGAKTADKVFLRLDARQTHCGISLVADKPEGLTADAALINQLRKHLPSATITHLWEEREKGDVWLALYTAAGEQGPAHWYLKLARSRPPDICLMNHDGLIYVSHGTRGTFTKKRSHEGSLPHQDPSLFHEGAGALWQTYQHEQTDGIELVSASHDDAVVMAADQTLSPSPTSTTVSLSPDEKALVQRLRRRLKTLRKARVRQESLIPDPAQVSQQDTLARLLQKYLYLVKEGDFALRLSAMESGLPEDIEIPLNAEASPGRNLEAYFSELKKQRKAQEIGARERQKIDRDIAEAEGALTRLLQGEHDLSPIAGLGLNAPGKGSTAARHEAPVAKPYRAFMSTEGIRVLVGKGAGENDELTKSAKGNDYWLHAVGVTGSHVIIPIVREIRDSLPARTMREAAILALHYSKLKGDMAGEVYLTRRGDLRKQKGMPKGLWNILRSDTFFIRYTAEEADLILSRSTVP